MRLLRAGFSAPQYLQAIGGRIRSKEIGDGAFVATRSREKLHGPLRNSRLLDVHEPTRLSFFDVLPLEDEGDRLALVSASIFGFSLSGVALLTLAMTGGIKKLFRESDS